MEEARGLKDTALFLLSHVTAKGEETSTGRRAYMVDVLNAATNNATSIDVCKDVFSEDINWNSEDPIIAYTTEETRRMGTFSLDAAKRYMRESKYRSGTSYAKNLTESDLKETLEIARIRGFSWRRLVVAAGLTYDMFGRPISSDERKKTPKRTTDTDKGLKEELRSGWFVPDVLRSYGITINQLFELKGFDMKHFVSLGPSLDDMLDLDATCENSVFESKLTAQVLCGFRISAKEWAETLGMTKDMLMTDIRLDNKCYFNLIRTDTMLDSAWNDKQLREYMGFSANEILKLYDDVPTGSSVRTSAFPSEIDPSKLILTTGKRD